MCLSYTGQIIQWAFWAQKAAREIYFYYQKYLHIYIFVSSHIVME